MEPSVQKDIIFIAGTTGGGGSPNDGIVGAVTFDNEMRLVAEKVITQVNLQSCTSIKRFESRDDIVVGGVKHLAILRFYGDGFEVFNIIENVHSGKLKHLSILIDFRPFFGILRFWLIFEFRGYL